MRWPGTGEPMTSLNQVVHVTLINLRTIPQRLGTSLVIVIGIAGVVGVLVSVLAMGEGFRHTLASTGRPTRVIMLRAGSDAEMSSGVAREQATVLGNLPRSEEHTSELQSQSNLVCRLLLEKKKKITNTQYTRNS